MNIKRLFCLLLALAMTLALTACRRGSFSEKLDDLVSGGTDDQDTGAGLDSGSDADTGDTGDTDTGADSDTGDTGTGAGGDTGDIPDYTAFSQGLDEEGRFEGVTALDFVTLPAYEDVILPTFEQVTGRAVEDGDFVNIDYVGSVDGVEFDGGSTGGAGTDVIIGVTSYIDDFLAQIIGHTPGETFDINVTFPEDYGVEDLNGKDAVFVTTVNYIWDFGDEDAQAVGFADKSEMAQYIAYGYATMENVAASSGINVFLTAAACGQVPDDVLETVRNHLSTQIDLAASSYGLDADTYAMYMYGASTASEYLDAQVPLQAQQSLIFQAVAEREGLTATDEDITDYEYESYVEVYGMPYVKYAILQDRVTEFLMENLG